MQTYKDLEIICVDNGSKDRTVEILEKLALQNKIIFLKEPTKGASNARNLGLKQAKGDWIQFLDADDLLLSSKITHQVELASSLNEEVAFIAGASIARKLNGYQIEKTISPIKHPYFNVFTIQSGNTCSNFWRRSALNAISGWATDLQSSQEADLMMRLVREGYSFVIDNKPLTIIRERLEGQISQTGHEIRLERFVELRVNFMQAVREEMTDPLVVNQMYDFLVGGILQYAKYNPAKAALLFDNHVRLNWRPTGSFGISIAKGWLLKKIGIKWLMILAK